MHAKNTSIQERRLIPASAFSYPVIKVSLYTYPLNKPKNPYTCLQQCHAGCRALIPEECNFGMVQPIFLPPSAVSIPRTEVPMEAIIGVHVRPPPSQRDFGCRKCLIYSGRSVARAAQLLAVSMCLVIRGLIRLGRL